MNKFLYVEQQKMIQNMKKKYKKDLFGSTKFLNKIKYLILIDIVLFRKKMIIWKT